MAWLTENTDFFVKIREWDTEARICTEKTLLLDKATLPIRNVSTSDLWKLQDWFVIKL